MNFKQLYYAILTVVLLVAAYFSMWVFVLLFSVFSVYKIQKAYAEIVGIANE